MMARVGPQGRYSLAFDFSRYVNGSTQASRCPMAGQAHEVAHLLVGLPCDDVPDTVSVPQ